MEQELESYIYILDKQEGPTYTIISFDPTLEAARKTMAKTSEARKVYPWNEGGESVYHEIFG